MRRTTVKDILAQEHSGGDYLVQGWVKTKRTSKNLSFIQLNDGSTIRDIQIVADQSLPNYSPDRVRKHRLQRQCEGHPG